MTIRLTAFTGLLAVLCFCISFIVIATQTEGYHYFTDYLSLLGAEGKPLALFWNLFGFVIVGILIAVFGWGYGVILNDKIVSSCLLITGIGFSIGGVPFNFSDISATYSVVHFVSISLSLAGWFLALARMAALSSIENKFKKRANRLIVLVLIPIIGLVTNIIPEPIAHRLIIIVIFSWIVITSVELLRVGSNQINTRNE